MKWIILILVFLILFLLSSKLEFRVYKQEAGKGEVLHADVKKDYLELIKNSISLGDKKNDSFVFNNNSSI